MKIRKTVMAAVATLCCLTFTLAQEPAKMSLPVKENFHLFLLAGQSNMAGRGEVAEEDRKIHPRVLALAREGAWVPAVDPIHFDKPAAGVGPGKSFGVFVADSDPKITVGLVPAACGGSPISAWEPGAYFSQTSSHPYDDALQRARTAMKDGTLKGILWHQGESDSEAALAPEYQARLERLIARFRHDLGVPDLPFLIGQLGQFEKAPWAAPKNMVDAGHRALAGKLTNVVFVKSDGLTPRSDNIHFDAMSQREFGKRYAAGYLKMQKGAKP
jgi:hypothetical protein